MDMKHSYTQTYPTLPYLRPDRTANGRRMAEQEQPAKDEWMGWVGSMEWMDGWMDDGWMDGWMMDGWMMDG